MIEQLPYTLYLQDLMVVHTVKHTDLDGEKYSLTIRTVRTGREMVSQTV